MRKAQCSRRQIHRDRRRLRGTYDCYRLKRGPTMPGCSIGLLFQGWSREVPLRLRLYHMPSRELPPLARGLPSPSCSASAGGGDHPRSRGVYRSGASQEDRPCGSSPLARGLLEGLAAALTDLGIIPARAGFTPRRGVRGLLQPDHPRSRGVYPRGTSTSIGTAVDHPRSRGVYMTSGRSPSR